jgi:hypothetical protein
MHDVNCGIAGDDDGSNGNIKWIAGLVMRRFTAAFARQHLRGQI